MKCLSIRQPWADLILRGFKDIENRTWSTKHRGRMLVHAGSAFDERGAASLPPEWRTVVEESRPRTGRILGSVAVVGCVTASDSPWFRGPVGWSLLNPVLFNPSIPYRGRLYLFDVPDGRLSRVREVEP